MVEFIETTIFSVAVITFGTAPFFMDKAEEGDGDDAGGVFFEGMREKRAGG